jgi:putative acetyltransferase
MGEDLAPSADTMPAPGTAPPSGLIVRARCREDAAGVAELVNLPGFRFGTMRLPFHSLDEVRGWLERPRDGDGNGDIDLVAVLDGRIVGSGGLHRLRGRRAHVGELGIGVHDDWTGRGIGTAILAALVEAADRWLGLRRLQLTVYVDNAPALALYRRFGFEIEGTHRAYAFRDGRHVDAHTMARLSGLDLAASDQGRERSGPPTGA